jgi:hypothetical protein
LLAQQALETLALTLPNQSGEVEELPRSPLEHFRSWGLAAPYDFQVAERVTIPG